MRGKQGFFAIKIDLEKAYDRLSWDFIFSTLMETCMDKKLIDVIMSCIRSTSLAINWNGVPSEYFYPSRGIRQGDPLSPYLFVLGMNKLSHLTSDVVDGGEWDPISVSNGGPLISHLMFADYLLLFGEASVQQMKVIMSCLNTFCEASGQKVNIEKSQLYFLKNVCYDMRSEIASVAGFKVVKDLGRYLGV